MRTVILTDPGTLELNYMWLPTWIGLNAKLKQEIETEVAPLVVGREITEQDLDQISDQVLDIIVRRCPVQGVRDYLDGLKFIQDP